MAASVRSGETGCVSTEPVHVKAGHDMRIPLDYRVSVKAGKRRFSMGNNKGGDYNRIELGTGAPLDFT